MTARRFLGEGQGRTNKHNALESFAAWAPAERAECLHSLTRMTGWGSASCRRLQQQALQLVWKVLRDSSYVAPTIQGPILGTLLMFRNSFGFALQLYSSGPKAGRVLAKQGIDSLLRCWQGPPTQAGASLRSSPRVLTAAKAMSNKQSAPCILPLWPCRRARLPEREDRHRVLSIAQVLHDIAMYSMHLFYSCKKTA